MTTNLSIDTVIITLQQRINHRLQSYLPAPQQIPARLHQAMHYAVFNGGKRVRPLLVYAIGLGFNSNLDQLDTAAAAIELIHCYSLVHDDLPAMDDDDYRRGKLSCHKEFDEATAILVGDALQSLAFELLAQPHPLLTSQQQTQMVHTLAKASGSLGMAGGQQLDLDTKNQSLSPTQIQQIHALKTGALFQAAISLAVIASTTEKAPSVWHKFGEQLGLAFQSQDDAMDGTNANTAKNSAQPLFDNVEILLAQLPINCEALTAVINYLKNRRN